MTPQRWAWAEIDLDAIGHNVEVLRQAVAPAAVWAVVKADGYGHGAVRTAKRAAAGRGRGAVCGTRRRRNRASPGGDRRADPAAQRTAGGAIGRRRGVPADADGLLPPVHRSAGCGRRRQLHQVGGPCERRHRDAAGRRIGRRSAGDRALRGRSCTGDRAGRGLHAPRMRRRADLVGVGRTARTFRPGARRTAIRPVCAHRWCTSPTRRAPWRSLRRTVRSFVPGSRSTASRPAPVSITSRPSCDRRWRSRRAGVVRQAGGRRQLDLVRMAAPFRCRHRRSRRCRSGMPTGCRVGSARCPTGRAPTC